MDNETSIIIFHGFRKVEECLSTLNRDMEDIKKIQIDLEMQITMSETK